MNLALKVFVLATSGGALVAGSGLADPGIQMEATCVRGGERVMLLGADPRWPAVVKHVNLLVSQSPRTLISWRADETVHLTFANGGWVEFRPDAAAIADDSLPPLTGISFAPAVELESARCDAV